MSSTCGAIFNLQSNDKGWVERSELSDKSPHAAPPWCTTKLCCRWQVFQLLVVVFESAQEAHWLLCGIAPSVDGSQALIRSARSHVHLNSLFIIQSRLRIFMCTQKKNDREDLSKKFIAPPPQKKRNLPAEGNSKLRRAHRLRLRPQAKSLQMGWNPHKGPILHAMPRTL